MTQAGTRVREWLLLLAPPLILFFVTLVVLWQYAPFQRSIYFDPGIFAYLSQLVAFGLAPHKYAFNEQASLTFLFGGAVMRLGDVFGAHHLISFRIAGMLVMASVVVLTYVTSKVFTRSRAVAFLAGLVLIGFHGYAVRAATTLEPKSLMLVLGLGTIYFLHKRKWLWAGACAGAAGLAWQIAWGYLVVAVLLAAVQGGKTFSTRRRGVAITLGAAFVVLALYFVYFFAHNAHVEMLQQTFLAPALMRQAVSKRFDARVWQMGKTFYEGFGTHLVFGALGAAGLVTWLGAHFVSTKQARVRAIARRAFYFMFQNRRTSATLLVVFGFLAYSFSDFQNYPDWIPLLPFVSMFAAWLLWTICLRVLKIFNASLTARQIAYAALACVVLSFMLVRITQPMGGEPTPTTWQQQQRVADELNRIISPDAPLWLLGKTDLLFFMQRTNVNKYIYIFGGVDRAVDLFEPEGFRGMVNATLAQRPALISLSRARPGHFSNPAHSKFIENAVSGLTLLDHCRAIGRGRYYTMPEFAEKYFAKNKQGCLKVGN